MKKLYLTILIIFGIANLSFADTQLWYPDTCNGCAFEVDKATFELVEVKAPDPAHPELSGKELYDKVLEENRRKNKTFAIIQELAPDFTVEEYKWFFDANRQLIVDLPVTVENKKVMQDKIDIDIGKDKVLTR